MITEQVGMFKVFSEGLLADLQAYLEPYVSILPDARLGASLRQCVPGLLAAGLPHLTKAAAQGPDQGTSVWARTKRFYRLMQTPAFSQRTWLRPLYADARAVAQTVAGRVVVALDPVNLENAYTRRLEGVSQVRKSTPPACLTAPSRARLTYGYPAILAQVVNRDQPAIAYLRLFSYRTVDFISETRELMRAMRTIGTVLRGMTVCVVADAGLDDQKLFHYADCLGLEFIIRASSNRRVEVYNPRLERCENEMLRDLVDTAPRAHRFQTAFTHAGRTTLVKVTLDWLQIRLPDTKQVLWVLISEGGPSSEPLLLITNRPTLTLSQAMCVYQDWRLRPMIEHLYRFIQEDGLDVEQIQLHTLERRRRALILVLLAALFALRLPHRWPADVLSWLRYLGSGTAGASMDRGGSYLLLAGLQAVLTAYAVLAAFCGSLPDPAGAALPPPLVATSTCG
jgi:Transposase DDE domain